MSSNHDIEKETDKLSSSSTPEHHDAYPHSDSEARTPNNENNNDDLERAKSKQSAVAENLPLWREILFISIVCCAQLFTQAGLGQGISILYSIGEHYNITNPAELSWLIAGYSLTVGTFILPSGRLGDIFGHKKILLIGFAWFGLWSLICGAAYYSNQVLFIFARVLQGIGPAIVLPNGLAIFGRYYPPGQRKSMVFAIFGACAPTGSVLGSAGAALFDLTFWPWAFWTLGIILFVVTGLGLYIIPDEELEPHEQQERENRTWGQTFEALDPWGALTGVLALVLFNFAWNQAPIYGWNQPYIYVLLIIGCLFVPVFFYIETRVSSNPLIPFDALTSNVAFVLGAVGLGWATFGIWFYYIWSFNEVLRGASPLLATAYVSPVVVSGSIAAITTGILLERIRPAWILSGALVAYLVGVILIMTTPVDQIYWAQIFVSAVITPWGMDMSFPAGTLIVSNSVERKHQGIGASLVNTVVNYSISLGLGFAGTVESHVNNGGRTPQDILLGYRGAWYMGTGLAGLGIFVCIIFLIKSYKKPLGAPNHEEKDESETQEKQ